MKRRVFLSFCALTTGWLFANPLENPPKKLPPHIYKTLQKVQAHIAPPLTDSTTTPTDFLQSTLFHPTYDKDIRDFVILGAQGLFETYGEELFTLGDEPLEKILREYEKDPFGSKWLNRIMILTLEGLLSDPIYGGNIQGSSWRALGEPPPNPQPKVEYIFG